jgi:uncharacterized protein (DUF433 family)
MYNEHVETLSISLPAFFAHFVEDYIAKNKSKSQSQVIQEALQLLYDREQGQTSHVIQKQANISGGRACIASTRLTVWNLVVWHQLGLSDQELLEKYPQLTQNQLEAAWNYYAHNKDEIDRDISENEEIDNLSDEELDKLLTVSGGNG